MKAFKSTEFNKPKQNRKDRNVSNQKKPSLLKESFSSVANIDFVKLTTHNFLISRLDGTRMYAMPYSIQTYAIYSENPINTIFIRGFICF